MNIEVVALDGVYGRPISGIHVHLMREGSGVLARTETDSGGRVADWSREQLERGFYRLVLDTDRYFAGLGVAPAYSEVVSAFRAQNESMTHRIHIVLSPSSYSIYFDTTFDSFESAQNSKE